MPRPCVVWTAVVISLTVVLAHDTNSHSELHTPSDEGHNDSALRDAHDKLDVALAHVSSLERDLSAVRASLALAQGAQRELQASLRACRTEQSFKESLCDGREGKGGGDEGDSLRGIVERLGELVERLGERKERRRRGGGRVGGGSEGEGEDDEWKQVREEVGNELARLQLAMSEGRGGVQGRLAACGADVKMLVGQVQKLQGQVKGCAVDEAVEEARAVCKTSREKLVERHRGQLQSVSAQAAQAQSRAKVCEEEQGGLRAEVEKYRNAMRKLSTRLAAMESTRRREVGVEEAVVGVEQPADEQPADEPQAEAPPADKPPQAPPADKPPQAPPADKPPQPPPAVETPPPTPPQDIPEHLLDPTDPDLRREAIKHEFMWAWKGYVDHAWGHDELHPVSMTGSDPFGMGLTIVDALDTMMIMGLDDEVARSRKWVAENLEFGSQDGINLFETTIRVLGGLLAAYSLSNDTLYLEKATQLADSMLIAFESPTGLPYGTLDLSKKSAHNPSWTNGASSIAEVGSIQLEWQYLSQVTNEPVYAAVVNEVMEYLGKHRARDGLFPVWIHPDTGSFLSSRITLGARADSLYEYFLKQWHLSKLPIARELYDDAVEGIVEKLLYKSTPSDLTFVAELQKGVVSGKMDHLVCFLPGVLALGAQDFIPDAESLPQDQRDEDMRLARELTETCVAFYNHTRTGLAPEIIQFDLKNSKVDFKVDPGAKHNLLRPETVESLFIMYRTTGEEQWREHAWRIFKAFRQHCRVPTGGYSSIKDVSVPLTDSHKTLGRPWSNWMDKMESFFLAETLKYLYLMFSGPDLIPLDEFVFNTEAHPLRIMRQVGM